MSTRAVLESWGCAPFGFPALERRVEGSVKRPGTCNRISSRDLNPVIQLARSMQVLLTQGSFAVFLRLLLPAHASQKRIRRYVRLWSSVSCVATVELLRCSAVAGVLNEWLIKKSQNVLEAVGNTPVQRGIL